MLSAESKVKVLEYFFTLDHIFFGKNVSKLDTCCPLLKEDYISTKGALLSVFIEMLKLVDHKPKKQTAELANQKFKKNVKAYAIESREMAEKIVKSQKARKNISETLKEALVENKKLNVDKFVKDQIREKAFSLATDHLLMARTLTESKNVKKLNKWEGKILEDSYRILRDNMVKIAVEILDGKDE